jgi:hypothetical protein
MSPFTLGGGITRAQHANVIHTDPMLAAFIMYRDPRNIVFLGHDYTSIGAGTWAMSGVPSLLTNTSFSNDPAAANGDNITYQFYAPPGTYELSILYAKHPNGGIVDISLNGINILAGLDTYANPLTVNHEANVAAIALTGPNPHSLKFTLNGKNGASGGYRIYPAAIFTLRRTA